MQTSILKDLTPQWFARQAPDIQLFIWKRCLSASGRLDLWRGLGQGDRAQLLAALGVGGARAERLTISVS